MEVTGDFLSVVSRDNHNFQVVATYKLVKYPFNDMTRPDLGRYVAQEVEQVGW